MSILEHCWRPESITNDMVSSIANMIEHSSCEARRTYIETLYTHMSAGVFLRLMRVPESRSFLPFPSCLLGEYITNFTHIDSYHIDFILNTVVNCSTGIYNMMTPPAFYHIRKHANGFGETLINCSQGILYLQNMPLTKFLLNSGYSFQFEVGLLHQHVDLFIGLAEYIIAEQITFTTVDNMALRILLKRLTREPHRVAVIPTSRAAPDMPNTHMTLGDLDDQFEDLSI